MINRLYLVSCLAVVLIVVGGCQLQPPGPPPCHILPADPYFVPYMLNNCTARQMQNYWDAQNQTNDPKVTLKVASAKNPTVWIDYDQTKHGHLLIVGFHPQTQSGMRVDDDEGPHYWVGIVLDFEDKS